MNDYSHLRLHQARIAQATARARRANRPTPVRRRRMLRIRGAGAGESPTTDGAPTSVDPAGIDGTRGADARTERPDTVPVP